MNTHKNARLTPHGRALLAARVIDEGLRPRDVAQAQGVSVRTVYKWVRRFREEGQEGLQDRRSRPARSPLATDA
ncbi:helix-turn-helix domain-containing protein, partial [Halomonas sp. KAO]|uniref:leucine zipper domain-containing protein n=1 Tax=Halomonas sp. KAO TaxID=2783858 RepID=UPI0018A02D4A